MKNILYILVFMLSSSLFSQEISEENESIVQPFFRVSFMNHSQLGNHSLAKDFRSDLGINTAFSIVTFKNFSLVTGFQFSYYSITNPQNVGNINSMFFRSLYAEIDYKIPVTKEIGLIPLVSYGYVNHKYQTGSPNMEFKRAQNLK